ncbi:MAG: hypothetical protein SOI31_10920, partial [Heyndrickxia coagulans]
FDFFHLLKIYREGNFHFCLSFKFAMQIRYPHLKGRMGVLSKNRIARVVHIRCGHSGFIRRLPAIQKMNQKGVKSP